MISFLDKSLTSKRDFRNLRRFSIVSVLRLALALRDSIVRASRLATSSNSRNSSLRRNRIFSYFPAVICISPRFSLKSGPEMRLERVSE